MNNIFDIANYLLEGTDYLQEGEYVNEIRLGIKGDATYLTNKGRVITSEEIENM